MSPKQQAENPTPPKGDANQNTTFFTVGLIFLVTGIALYVGDNAAGLPFFIVGLTFLILGGGLRLKNRTSTQDDPPHP
ncbi:MAG: hypothetical protein ACTHWA_10390 [Arachnia sp.]